MICLCVHDGSRKPEGLKLMAIGIRLDELDKIVAGAICRTRIDDASNNLGFPAELFLARHGVVLQDPKMEMSYVFPITEILEMKLRTGNPVFYDRAPELKRPGVAMFCRDASDNELIAELRVQLGDKYFPKNTPIAHHPSSARNN